MLQHLARNGLGKRVDEPAAVEVRLVGADVLSGGQRFVRASRLGLVVAPGNSPGIKMPVEFQMPAGDGPFHQLSRGLAVGKK